MFDQPRMDWFFFPLFQRGTEGDSTALMIHPTIAIGSDAEAFIPPNPFTKAFIVPLFRGCRKNNHLRRLGWLPFS